MKFTVLISHYYSNARTLFLYIFLSSLSHKLNTKLLLYHHLHLQHLVFCHVRKVHRHRYTSELYSIIGDANAVKEIDFVHKDWCTNLGIQGSRLFQRWKNTQYNEYKLKMRFSWFLFVYSICVYILYICTKHYITEKWNNSISR